MKISFYHPTTKKRTSVTINDSLVWLCATTNGWLELPMLSTTSSPDLSYLDDGKVRSGMFSFISVCALEYVNGDFGFKTFVSYVEHRIALEVDYMIKHLWLKQVKAD
ncbi:hypothetical protein [Vibrio sp. FF145]|uniref:hypothetical protein n=1 Tax=Vibrio sp. FF145 TaxID=3230013 RepID=UPI00352F0D18